MLTRLQRGRDAAVQGDGERQRQHPEGRGAEGYCSCRRERGVGNQRFQSAHGTRGFRETGNQGTLSYGYNREHGSTGNDRAGGEVCRLLLAAFVSGPPSLLTAADLSSGTIVSRAPVLPAMSIGQSSLVSRLSEASGAVSRLEVLVSHSPSSPAATISLGSSSFRMLALSFSISLNCCVPTTLQACQHLPTPNTCAQTQLLSSRACHAPGLASPSSLF